MSLKDKSLPKERYNALDGLRVFACMGIVAMHVRANIAVMPSESFLTSNIIAFAGDFVFLFMMVSAFALSCGYYNKFESGSIRIGGFYKKRYTRILPFFALLTVIDVIKTVVSEHFAFTDALKAELYEAFANCTLLFGLIPDNNITVVGVGWFIGVIFVFYLCYPFFTFLIGSKRKVWIATLLSLGLYLTLENYFVLVKGCSFGNASFMKCSPYFMLGGLVYVYRKQIVYIMQKKEFRILLWSISLGFSLYFFLLPDNRIPFANLIMYTLWLVYAISEVSFSRKITLLNNKVMAFLANVSMEVYLCHMMFFRVIEAIHIEKYVDDNDFCYLLTFVLVLSFAVSFSWLWKKWCEPRVLKVIE